MSRGAEGRSVAWQVWRHFHARDGLSIVAFEHQCGAMGAIDEDDDGAMMVCPGCRFELARPEWECTPLYRPKAAS